MLHPPIILTQPCTSSFMYFLRINHINWIQLSRKIFWIILTFSGYGATVGVCVPVVATNNRFHILLSFILQNTRTFTRPNAGYVPYSVTLEIHWKYILYLVHVGTEIIFSYFTYGARNSEMLPTTTGHYTTMTRRGTTEA